MVKPKHHIFVCTSSRINGEPKGGCKNKNAADLILYLETELLDRGMGQVMVSNSGCLKACDRGPVMVIYPEGYWYGNVTEAVIDDILDALEEGRPAEKYILT